jgi:ABC-type branched-subunit amino acid transport system ATPase component
VSVAFAVASYGYVLSRGAIVLEGDPQALANSPQLKQAYLGMT